MSNIQQYINSVEVASILNGADFTQSEAKQMKEQIMSLVLNDASGKLELCTPSSLFNVALQIKSFGLPLGTDRAYVIPYGKVAQLQIGYKGYIERALASGNYKSLNVSDVRQGESGSINRLKGTRVWNWIENDEERKLLPIIGYVSFFEMNNGFSKELYMDNMELHNHFVEYSKSYNIAKKVFNGGANIEAMKKKTCIKLLLGRYGVMDSSISKMRAMDSAAILDNGTPDYIDNHEKNITFVKKGVVDQKKTMPTKRNTKFEAEQMIEQPTISKEEIDSMNFGNYNEIIPPINNEEDNLKQFEQSGDAPSDKQQFIIDNNNLNPTGQPVSKKEASSLIGDYFDSKCK